MIAKRFEIASIVAAVVVLLRTGCGATVSTTFSTISENVSLSAVASPSPSEDGTLSTTTEPAEQAPEGAIVIDVGPGPDFTPDALQAEAADTLTFFLDMSEASPGHNHNFNIGAELPPGAALATSDLLTPGESAIVTVTGLAPGTYQYWCTIEDHYTFGMRGVLTVE